MTVEISGDARLAAVLGIVTERTGLAFHPARIETAEACIVAAMEQAGVGEPAVYAEILAADNLALDDLVAGLTIGETYFFREPAVFDFLRRDFLPGILRECGREHVLRVWSAGCASGEEAYSLAILMEEEGWDGRYMMLGTDICRASLLKARRGSYGPWSFRGTDESFVRRYFAAKGREFALSRSIRERSLFQYHNLALDTYPSLASGIFGMDLVLCRNVLIYFEESAIRRVAKRLYESLNEGGMLVTASADPPLQGMAPFTVVRSEVGILYVRGRIVPAERVEAMARPGMMPDGGPNRPVQVSDTHRKSRRKPAGRASDAVERRPTLASGPVVSPVQEALEGGDYTRVLEMVRGREDETGIAIRVRALANVSGAAAAAEEAGRGMARHPLSAEIAFLRAVLLAGSGRHAEAVNAARGVLYLDSSQPAGHFVLGAALWNCSELDGARREFRNARDLAAALPAGIIVPFTDGETAGRLAQGAAAQLAMLEPEGGGRA